MRVFFLEIYSKGYSIVISMNINKKLIISVLVIILVLLLIFTIYLLLIKPLINGELSFNVPIKENFDSTNQSSLTINSISKLPSNLQKIITDFGFTWRYQGLANLQGNNNGLNDYIRYCGDDNGLLYTALYGDITQYSTIEKVVDGIGTPYTNGSNMPSYSLYNPTNNRTINLNSDYAVSVYNRLNDTNYKYNGVPVIIKPEPTTTSAPTTTKHNCSFYIGNILNEKQTNINNCNTDSNCYYIGGNCWDYSASNNINNIDLTCYYTEKNPNSNSSPYILSLGCNNNNKDDKKYYIIQSINYKDTNGNTNYLYRYNPSSNDNNNSSKNNIPFIYNGSLYNISDVLANTNQIYNINITDIKGNTKNFKLTNTLLSNTSVLGNTQKINAPNYALLSQIQALSTAIIGNISNSSS